MKTIWRRMSSSLALLPSTVSIAWSYGHLPNTVTWLSLPLMAHLLLIMSAPSTKRSGPAVANAQVGSITLERTQITRNVAWVRLFSSPGTSNYNSGELIPPDSSLWIPILLPRAFSRQQASHPPSVTMFIRKSFLLYLQLVPDPPLC